MTGEKQGPWRESARSPCVSFLRRLKLICLSSFEVEWIIVRLCLNWESTTWLHIFWSVNASRQSKGWYVFLFVGFYYFVYWMQRGLLGLEFSSCIDRPCIDSTIKFSFWWLFWRHLLEYPIVNHLCVYSFEN